MRMGSRMALGILGLLVGLLVAPVTPQSAALGAESPRPPKPVVTKVKSTTGPTAGGTRVVIRGRHLAEARKVLFGQKKALRVRVVNGTTLVVRTPPHRPARVNVRVVTRGGKSVPSRTYTFMADPPPVEPPVEPPSEGPATDVVSDIVCPASGLCFALGSSGPDLAAKSAVLHTLEDGTWTRTAPPLPSGVEAPGAVLTDIDCGSADSCVAVGHAQDGGLFADVWDGETWEPSTVLLPDGVSAADHPSVSCAGAAWCVLVADASPVVGSVWNGTSWSSALLPLPPGSDALTDPGDIDCPVAGWCAATALHWEYEANNYPRRGSAVLQLADGVWSVAPNGRAGTTPLNGSFSDPRGFSRITCVAVSHCVATGSYEPVYVLDGETGTYSTGRLPVTGGLADIVCPDDVLPCRTAGNTRTGRGGPGKAYLASVGDGDPDLVEVPLPGGFEVHDPENPLALVNAMVCVDATRCLAVGSRTIHDDQAPYGQRPVGLLLHTSPSVGYADVPGPAGAGLVSLNDVALVDASHAAVVGEYVDALSGETRPLLLTVEVP